MASKLLVLLTGLFLFLINASTTQAVVNPLSVPNNPFGIHLLAPIPEETKDAKTLVNSSGGDWGYVTVLIESKDRDKAKWQGYFDDLRRSHLIPLVRLATKPDGSFWEKPDEN